LTPPLHRRIACPPLARGFGSIPRSAVTDAAADRPLDDDGVQPDALGGEELRRREPIICACAACRRIDEIDPLGRCFACAGERSKNVFRAWSGP